MLAIEWAGQVDYLTAWDRQKELVRLREISPYLDDHLLLLEHPPTYTLGRHGHMENLLLDESELQERGIALYRVDRGGDITYHGPGQLVGYPILYLERYYGRGIGRIRSYVASLEQIIVRVLEIFDIKGRCLEGHRGVWVETGNGLDKIAAVGVRVTGKGISSHGFALNVNPDLDYFSGIVPCGISDHGVISMAAILDRPLSLEEVIPLVSAAFHQEFAIAEPTNVVGDLFGDL